MIYKIYNAINESMIDEVIDFMGTKINCTIDNFEFCKKDLPVLKKNFDHIVKMSLSDGKIGGLSKKSISLKHGSYTWNPKTNIATYTLNFTVKNNPNSLLVIKVNINDSKVVGYSSKFEDIKSNA